MVTLLSWQAIEQADPRIQPLLMQRQADIVDTQTVTLWHVAAQTPLEALHQMPVAFDRLVVEYQQQHPGYIELGYLLNDEHGLLVLLQCPLHASVQAYLECQGGEYA